ncbi:MAG: ABC transporter substrate-binding protein [Dysgonamonadaceae bacterium]|jgi:iron complex transport system substrate-binding protein|nr:ABC transporter substrate-binding protein [Dysgonamonadaceae bacterium]
MKNQSLVIYYLSLVFCLAFFSCKQKEDSSIIQTHKDDLPVVIDTLVRDRVYYAQGFQVETLADYTLITIRNPWNPKLTLQRYVLLPKAAAMPDSLPEGIIIRTPIERTVSYGSVHCSFLDELGVSATLVGVCEPRYINIPQIQEGIRSGRIANLGQSSNPDIEKITLIEPEVLFTAPIEGTGYGNQITQLGIPLIECTDYMESSPLGRAEWIRCLALFFDKGALADSLFMKTITNYNQLRKIANELSSRPTVMAETIYNGIWYVPGGNSYIAHFFRDAGADYFWKEDTHTGSIGLSFESVLEKAEKANVWLIKYNSNKNLTYEDLAKDYPNYVFFEAYRQKSIYACNTGKVPYYEELPLHPDYILKDMVWIFHPELLSDYQPRYYEKLK